MSITKFLNKQELERQKILKAIHEVIINADKAAKPEIGKIMGKEMILYKTSGVFKYGLASAKAHMSLHVMPMYGSPKIHSKYEKLLIDAKFQKGCINFKNAASMPVAIVEQLIHDCSKIDLVSMMEEIKQNPNLKYF